MTDVLVLVICAVLIRLLLLPFTLKTDRYFSVMRFLIRTLNNRISSIAVKCEEDPQRACVEEMSAINKTLNQIQTLKKPVFFIIPILLQAAAYLYLFLKTYKGSRWKVEFLWIRDLLTKDPYYLLPFIFLIFLIIRHHVFIPHKMKFVLSVPALMLFVMALNRGAAFNIFAICLMILSIIQSIIVNQKYNSPSIEALFPKLLSAQNQDGKANVSLSESDNNNDLIAENFDLDNWLHHFKKKASIFLYDDMLISLLLLYFGLAGMLIFALYWSYFYWRRKREWLLDR